MKNRCIILLACLICLSGNAMSVNTHIQTDNTLAGIDEFNINAPGSGQLHTLSEINGKVAGNNLFYSFSDFNIGTGDTAWFNLNTPSLTNVISRVAGGSTSLIDGQLKMTNVGSNPSFFLINPAGITFSSGASVDVPGSFYVSTASGLNFSDGSQWTVSNSHTSSLSVASPESFGFLGDEASGINIVGATNLVFKAETTVVFVGNQIDVENTKIKKVDSSGSGFDMRFIATGDATSSIGLTDTSNRDISLNGDLSLRNITLEASGHGLGYIMAHAGCFTAINSFMTVDSFDDTSAIRRSSIDFQADSILLDASIIYTTASSAGNAGGISISSKELTIVNNGIIQNGVTNDSAQIGRISITTDVLKMVGGKIGSDAIPEGTFRGGSISIDAEQVTINSGGIISAATLKSTGNAGDIAMTVTSLEINDGSISALTTGDGDAGDIVIATQVLELGKNGFITSSSGAGEDTRNVDASTGGNAGNIFISSKQASLDGVVLSSTSTSGDAGDITVTTDILKIHGLVSASSVDTAQGNGGDVTIVAKEIEIEGTTEIDGKSVSSGISANTSSKGNAGNVTVNAEYISLRNSGSIQAAVNNQKEGARGHGGSIVINVNQLDLVGGFISSRTLSNGDAGNITISTEIMKLDDSGRILAGSGSSRVKTATGDGGFISIDAKEMTIGNSFIVNETYGSGNGGKISITSNSVQLHPNGFISASTFGSGNSGNIHVATNDFSARGTGASSAQINLSSDELTGIFGGAAQGSSGQIGDIAIYPKNNDQLNVRLENGAYISIENGATATDDKVAALLPAVIDIDATNLFLKNSFITTQSNGNIDAGNINIHFNEQLFLDPSQITTEAVNGNGGDITIIGDGTAFLLDSAITTSVGGQSGNGGDISIVTQGLILNSGFIRANTAASGASGGDITIRTPALIPSGNLLFVGGNTPFQFQPFSGLNVIQAAAPDGVSGTVNVTTPQLNLNAMLTNLAIESFDNSELNRDMCAVSESSSLLQSGRGAQPLRAKDLLLSPKF